MAALKCEICGGKLMAKSGGLFECEYCGMQYDKTRIQEMVQEIKGTVQVAGTVEVKGTVAVDNKANIENLLKRIAICAKDKDFKTLLALTEDILKLNPECGKAYLWKIAARFKCRTLDDLFKQHLYVLEKIVESSEWENAMVYSGSQESEHLKQLMDNAIQYWKKPNPELKKRFDEIQPVQDLLHICDTAIIGLRADGKVHVTYSQKDSWVSPVKKWTGIKKILTDADYHYVIGLKWDGTVVVACQNSTSCKDVLDVQRWAENVVEIAAYGNFVACLDSDGVLGCSLNEFDDDDVFYFGYTEDWNDVTDLEIVTVRKSGVSGEFWGRDVFGIDACMVLGITKSGNVKCSASAYDLGDAQIEEAIDVGFWEKQRGVSKIDGIRKCILYRDGTMYAHGYRKKDEKWLDFSITDTGCYVKDTFPSERFIERDLIAECCGYALRADGTILRERAIERVNKSNWADAKPDQWTNLVALDCAYMSDHPCVIGLRENGTVLIAWAGEPHPDICVENWHLFETAKTFLKEREDAQKQQEDEQRRNQEEVKRKKQEAALKKQEEERKKQEKLQKIAQEWRNSGLCQYCGGEFKGLFFKRCVCCGSSKDY